MNKSFENKKNADFERDSTAINADFERNSTAINRLKIALPNFKYNHGPENQESEDSYFIGRESISNLLRSWLTNNPKDNGVYLVSGYRGMGKTSFVNKVLNEISNKPLKKTKDKLLRLYLFIGLTIIIIGLFCIFSQFDPMTIRPLLYYSKYVLVRFGFGFFLAVLAFVAFWAVIQILIGNRKKKYHTITLKLNLGHEILNERQILSLISKNLQVEYEYYISKENEYFPSIHLLKIYFNLLFSIALTVVVIYVFSPITQLLFSGNQTIGNNALNLISNYFSAFKFVHTWFCSGSGLIVQSLILIFTIYPFSKKVFKLITVYVSKYFNIPLHFSNFIVKELKHINDRINSTVTEEKVVDNSISIKSSKVNSGGEKKTKTYPLAQVPEIEQELITIFQRISNTIFPPNFIIVFDELDKLEVPNNNASNKDHEIMPEFENVLNGSPGGEASRKKKHNLLNLLANLKYFISTANSKFIFIAGRELYDASLADVADREFVISSIFNGVIYVNSFLTSNNYPTEISTMTERYICRRLIPKSFIDQKYCKKFNKPKDTVPPKREFEEMLSLENFRDYLNYYKQNKLDSLEIDRIVLFLYHFSIYLSHFSNGAPKKIASYFEKYVRLENVNDNEDLAFNPVLFRKKLDKSWSKKQIDKLKSILKGNSQNADIDIVKISKDYYPDNKQIYVLSFGNREQQSINFIHYMANPVIQAVINKAGGYSDKLLLSATFLMDHIYKYHNEGFSWRNLELVPELLDINKTPELRAFIESIIHYLKQTHLSPVVSGVYNLKFPKKIAEEISVFSKLSEEVSAMFNFTLDESLSVKRHYLKLLNYYSDEQLTRAISNKDVLNHDRVLAGIHHSLGDLYLSDEEYTNAIFQFQKCASILSIGFKDDKKKVDPSQFLFYIRNMLKLGLAYEKRKTYDSAYMLYNELVTKLMKYREIEEKDFHLKFNNDTDQFVSIKKKQRNQNNKEEYIGGVEVDRQKILQHLIKNISPRSDEVLSQMTLFDEIKFIYQPLLAKVFILEKMDLGGITNSKLEEIKAEFNFLNLITLEEERYAIMAIFYRELGDILYYKNSVLHYKSDNYEVNGQSYKPKDAFKLKYLWGDILENSIEHYLDKKYYLDKKETLKDRLKKIETERKTLKCYYLEELSEDDFMKNIIDNKDEKSVKKWLWEHSKSKICIDFYTEELKDGSIRASIYPKISYCYDKRKNKGIKSPCYACIYYNESLRILIRNIFGGETEHNVSKVLMLWGYISDKKTVKNLRDEQLSLIAKILDNLGNVMFSCSSEDIISNDFLNYFFDKIKEVRTGSLNSLPKSNITDYNVKNVLTYLERSILYFWTSAEYYSSSNSKEAFLCLKKILHIFLNYSIFYKKKHTQKEQNPVVCKLDKIKDEIVNLAIRNIYSHYENANLAENQRLKLMFDVKIYKDLPLDYLSITPDLDELLSIYAELLLVCEDKPKQSVIAYKNLFQKRLKIETTVAEKVMMLRLKAVFNRTILNQLLSNDDSPFDLESFSTKYWFQAEVVFRLDTFLKDKKSLKKKLGDFEKCFNDTNTKSQISEKLNFVEYLISDSFSCLSRVLEIISPLQYSSLFPSSLTADIHRKLFEWNLFYEQYYSLSRYADYSISLLIDHQKNKKLIKEKFFNFMKRRYKSSSQEEKNEDKYCINEKLKNNEIENLLKEIRFNSCSKSIIKYLENAKEKNNRMSFFTYEQNNSVNKSRVQYLGSNYQAEMALKKYRSVEEFHSEGKIHKESMLNMYLLDDDLNNDTCQFHYAIERYKINSGYFRSEMTEIKKSYWDSGMYDSDNYIGSKRSYL